MNRTVVSPFYYCLVASNVSEGRRWTKNVMRNVKNELDLTWKLINEIPRKTTSEMCSTHTRLEFRVKCATNKYVVMKNLELWVYSKCAKTFFYKKLKKKKLIFFFSGVRSKIDSFDVYLCRTLDVVNNVLSLCEIRKNVAAKHIAVRTLTWWLFPFWITFEKCLKLEKKKWKFQYLIVDRQRCECYDVLSIYNSKSGAYLSVGTDELETPLLWQNV